MQPPYLFTRTGKKSCNITSFTSIFAQIKQKRLHILTYVYNIHVLWAANPWTRARYSKNIWHFYSALVPISFPKSCKTPHQQSRNVANFSYSATVNEIIHRRLEFQSSRARCHNEKSSFFPCLARSVSLSHISRTIKISLPSCSLLLKRKPLHVAPRAYNSHILLCFFFFIQPKLFITAYRKSSATHDKYPRNFAFYILPRRTAIIMQHPSLLGVSVRAAAPPGCYRSPLELMQSILLLERAARGYIIDAYNIEIRRFSAFTLARGFLSLVSLRPADENSPRLKYTVFTLKSFVNLHFYR